MRNLILLFKLSFIFLVLISCQNCSNNEDPDNNGSSVEQHCNQTTSFSETSGGSTNFDWENFTILDSYGYYESFGKAYVLYITNFEVTEEKIGQSFGLYSPIQGEAMIQIILDQDDNEEFLPGVYDFDSANDLECYLIMGTSGVSITHGFTDGPSGEATITFIDRDKVCGNINVTTSNGMKLIGEFSITLR